MSEETLTELRRRHERGELSRDAYWRAAQQLVMQLRERTPLPADGPVKRVSELHGELVMELRDGLRLHWDPADLRTAPNMLLFHGEYERREGEILRALVGPDSVVVDAGANVGWYTLMLARIVRAGPGRVYAFEPVPTTFRALERNVGLNEDVAGCVSLLPFGLGVRDEAAELFLPAETGSVAASRRPLFPDQANQRVPVRMARLDDVATDLGLGRLDLIKADVEGGELLLVQGALATIRRFRPVLFLELLRKWSAAHGYHPDDVLQLLRTEGYASYAITPRGVESVDVVDDACESTNFLFVDPSAHGAIVELLSTP